jgi:alpha-tubulin suppressor-like RCC1 family protein
LGDGTGRFSVNWPEKIVSSNVVAVACGLWHSLFLKSNGSLWDMGYNAEGELGNGTFNNADRPMQIVSNDVVAISAGGNHSLFLKTDGSLWAMGWNHDGELGDGTFYTNAPWGTNKPEQIVASNVVAIAGGLQHSLFLKSDGSLWATGGNLYGQLGDGTQNTFRNVPEQVVPNGVVAIAAGNYYSLFLKSDGSLWVMGQNQTGGLGDGFNGGDSVLPEQIVPSPQPIFASASIPSYSNLQLSAPCFIGGNYITLAGTNLTQPLEQWVPVCTNSVTVRGTNNFIVTLTNIVNSGATQQFYILQSQ